MQAARRLEGVITEALSKMAGIGYSTSYVRFNRQVYGSLSRFCSEQSIETYSATVGKEYLEAREAQHSTLCNGSIDNLERAIRRLDCVISETEWRPIRKAGKAYTESIFIDIVAGYEVYLRESGKSRHDIRNGAHIVSRFLKQVEQNGCPDLNALDAKCVYQSLQSPAIKAYAFLRIIKPFLRYAHTYGLIGSNLALIVPGEARRTNVPTVYTPEEVEELLASIDRSTSLGKRNYAIVLTVARLGLRASDIAGMTFSSLNFQKSTIEITQKKTKLPLKLPLLDDVRDVLRDYIDNGRPKTQDGHIFMNSLGYGAMTSQSVSSTVMGIFERSGVDYGDRKHGPHSLRSSLATALLSEGNDYTIIQRTLGHSDIQSSKSYVRADVEQLRINALPVPPPSGRFGKIFVAEGVAYER